MDGFKNTTKTQYSMGGYAKGGKSMGKIGVVMHEFGEGKLHSGSKKGPAVTSPKQAVAIALSEARKAGAKIPVKKADGGYMAPPKGGPMDTESSAPVKPGTGKRLMAQAKVLPPKGMGVMTDAERKYAMAHETAMPPRGMGAMTERERFKAMATETAMPGHKKGGAIKGPVVERAKSMSVKTKMSPSVSAQEMRTMQKYKAAMASRINREPMLSAAPVAPSAPMMKKGGKVMKNADGGMATSLRPAKDYHTADQDFVAARANQLNGIAGRRMAEGGMDAKQDKAMAKADIKQDKAMAKADVKQDKAMIKAAIHKHEQHDHPGKPLTKLRKGGAVC
jgi:hypothetical protein